MLSFFFAFARCEGQNRTLAAVPLCLGPVDLCWLSFVRVKDILIEANGLMPSHLSKIHSTKSKTFLAEPFGQRLLAIFTALSTFYVE
ncbi:hypothetical protein Sden_0293 [Shewanella denitrificans OS217]|uniref:Uncharacterized protein n=1 Tax=Shewanella denitrificans (strain OS217 / ATCC BAA-1090 / DSM 15013) TaxID=318161 RepID=Q12SI7_SHEDO|nr:hypothetical protein Sden_0293 [Shewanella denitrificans OS217]